MKKVAVITGCSTGIGHELAIQLNSLGWTVVATSRHPEKLEPLKEAGCLTYLLDVTDSVQIDVTFDKIIKTTSRIDMLINNAGFGLIMPSPDISMEEMKSQFQTNFFGVFAVIQKVSPIMKVQKSGIIVNTGSISGIAPTPFAGAYCASKAALHAWSDTLRMELKPFGIKIITLQPGGIETEFGKNCTTTVKRLLRPASWYSSIETFIYKRAYTSQEKATPAALFVRKVIRKITSPDPPAVIRSGKRSFTLPLMKRFLPEKILDKMMMKKYGLDQLKK
jgi:short-subunit dehydrogenase